MSKIEEALQTARRDRRSPLPPGQLNNAHAGDNEILTARPGFQLAEAEARQHSASAIERMRKTHPLDKEALALYRLIYPEMGDQDVVQAFRELRTKILQATHSHNCVIMVTGVTPHSGSTFVARNLSVAFAFDAGKTALLLDCNLHDPSAHRLMREADAIGLTDFLDNTSMDLSRIIYPIGIERLRVIPVGRNRDIPTEYFTTGRMKLLIESLRKRYPERFIVVDAPSMTNAADTQILAEWCDHVLLVVPYGKVVDAQIEDCVKALDRKKMLGVVFNNEPRAPAWWSRKVHSSA